MRKILVACEYSGIVREAFKKKGWDAWSCDIIDTEIPGNHYQCDVLTVLDKGWDLLIGHPSCQYLCNSGVRWLHERPERWVDLDKAADFFKRLWNANIPKICLENPIPHKYALERIGTKYSQIIQPYQFGCPESKATALWLKNLTLLKPTNIIPKEQRKQSIWKTPPSKDRSKIRSKTFIEIAEAMANSWGE